MRRLSLLLALLLALTGLGLVSAPSGSAGTAVPGGVSQAHGKVAAGVHAKKKQKKGKKGKKKDPRLSRGLYVDPSMKAYNAGPAFTAIGRKAQPLWITDYYDDPAAATRAYVAEAERARKTPLLVVYNIPDRDCGMYSSQDDQITDVQYRAFVSKVARGIKAARGKPLLVLEPDALPFIGNPSCTGVGDRLGLLRYAVRALSRAGAWVYIDAGHSGWQTPEHMAPLLKAAGVASARGFATNVANSRTEADETTYATAMIRELKKLKVGGVRYVRDTSRNGAGAAGPENGDVCNPMKARLGKAPRLTFKGAYDGNLWVKLPGESDGPCNGGPSSGEWFATGACRLLRGESAYYDSGARACRS